MLVTSDNVNEILERLKNQKVLFFDIETTGLEVYEEACAVGIGVATSAKDLYYFPFRHSSTSDSFLESSGNLDFYYMKPLIDIFNNSHYLIAHNIKFDLAGLLKEGLIVRDQILIDTLVMGRLIQTERFSKLDLVTLYQYVVNPNSIDNKDELKQYKKEHKIKDPGCGLVPPIIIDDYCSKDLLQLYELYFALKREIKNTDQKRIHQLEIETTKTLFFMESFGAQIDSEYCQKIKVELDDKIVETEEKIYDITKEKIPDPINILSNLQLGKMFNLFGIHSLVTTPAGKECWDEKALLQIDHLLVGLIKEYRTLRKLRDTYFTPFLNKSVVHSSFKNWGTVTGRLSSGNPNLQNIPRYQKSLSGEKVEMDEEKRKRILAMAALRKTTSGVTAGGSSLSSWGFTGDEKFNDKEELVSVRRLFIARPDYYLYSFDFSQMEIRVFISYLNNPKIFEEMKSEEFDFHSFVATLVFGYEKDHPDFKFWRQIAKAITFGLIYGMGNDLLAGQMGKSVEEAASFRKLYFSKLEGSHDFIKKVQKTIQDRGNIHNRYGRKYFLPENKSYVGVNYLVQGTTGDLVKDRMNAVFSYLLPRKSKLINQIHDEIIVEVHKDEEDEVSDKIIRILEKNPFDIPLSVDKAKCYPSWAHKKEA